MKVAIIGAGSWGTALAQSIASNNHNVGLWARKSEVVSGINTQHHNPRYLSETELSSNIVATLSYQDALLRAQAALVVTPSNLVRGVGRAFRDVIDSDLPILVCSKGIEDKSGLNLINVMADEVGNIDRIAVLSGPNHAEEVIKGLPSASVIASSHPDTSLFFRDLLATDTFRTYTSDDPIGVQLCGAFKNVIAIAVGISYGLGYEENTAALLLTRGLAEMSRMVVACGGLALTCMGLAGTGDMVATCMSRHSRNRCFGQDYIAQGKTLDDFYADTHMVVEGAQACKTLEVLSRRYNVELPITDAVRAVVWEGSEVEKVASLLSDRPLKAEFYGI